MGLILKPTKTYTGWDEINYDTAYLKVSQWSVDDVYKKINFTYLIWKSKAERELAKNNIQTIRPLFASTIIICEQPILGYQVNTPIINASLYAVLDQVIREGGDFLSILYDYLLNEQPAHTDPNAPNWSDWQSDIVTP